MKLEVLAGNGKKIGLLTLPFLTVGLILNILYPTYFQIGGPSKALYDTAIALSDKFYKEMNCDNAFKEFSWASIFANKPTKQFDYLLKLRIINEKKQQYETKNFY